MPKSASAVPDWLFPDSAATKPSRPRPKSIVDVEDDAADERHEAKRRRLNEMCRYDVNKGGALGVGMGVSADEDRVIIDDLDLK
jgi:enhancer of polycomb-like protein